MNKETLNSLIYNKKNGLWLIPNSFFLNVKINVLSLFLNIDDIKFQDLKHGFIFEKIINYLKSINIIERVEIFFENESEYYITKVFLSLSENQSSKTISTGVSFNKYESISIALGECLERYITGAGDTNKTQSLFCKDVAEDCIYLPIKYHEIKNFNQEMLQQKISWVEANDVKNRKILIPKQLASWNYKKTKLNESPLTQATTNGAAGFFDINKAKISGLLELNERDAFLLYWYLKVKPQKIDISSDLSKNLYQKTDILKILNIFKEKNILIYLLNITSDTQIPTVCVVAIENKDGIKKMAVTASSSIDFVSSIESSLKEMLKISNVFNIKKTEQEIENSQKINPELFSQKGNVINMEDRASLWRGEIWFDRFKWIIEGESADLSDLEMNNTLKEIGFNGERNDEIFSNLSLRLCEMGKLYTPIVYCPKNKIQKVLNFHVCQVFVRGFLPFYLNEFYRIENSKRFETFLQYMYKQKKLNSTEIQKIKDSGLNIWPHPFY